MQKQQYEMERKQQEMQAKMAEEMAKFGGNPVFQQAGLLSMSGLQMQGGVAQPPAQ